MHNIYIYIYISLSLSLYIYIYICVCVYVCVCVFVSYEWWILGKESIFAFEYQHISLLGENEVKVITDLSNSDVYLIRVSWKIVWVWKM